MSFSILDGFILIVLAGGLLRGVMVGAVRQITSLVGLLVAFLFALQFMRPIGELIATVFNLTETIGLIVSFVVVFVGVQLIFVLLARLIEQVLETLSLTLINRAAGGAVGGFKAVLLLSLLFLVLAAMNVPSEETREKSRLYDPVAQALPQTVDATAGWLPAAKRMSDEWGEQLRPQLKLPKDRSAEPEQDEESTLVTPGREHTSVQSQKCKDVVNFKKM